MRFSSLILALAPSCAWAQGVPSTEVFHGMAVMEEFRWLEDANSPGTRAWVEAQRKATSAYLERLPGREALRSRISQLYDYDRYPSVAASDGSRAGYFRRGKRIFFLRQRGLQNQPVLFVQDPGNPERALLDANTLSSAGTVAVSTFSISRDGRWLAFAVADAGSDWVTWRVRDVSTGRDLPDVLKWSKFSSAEWDAASLGFYYGRYPAPEPGSALQSVNENFKLFYHRLNTPQSADRLVFERPGQPRWSFSPTVSEDGRYLVIEVRNGTSVDKQMYYQELLQPGAPFKPLVDEFYAAQFFLGNRGSKFYLLTNYQAPRYRVVEIDLASPACARWRTVVPEHADTIKQAQLVAGHFVLNYMHHVSGRVALAPLTGGPLRQLNLPANASITLGEASSTVFSVTGFTRPETLYACDPLACRPQFPSRLPFDPDRYETRQFFASSKDGTRVPLFVTHRKGLVPDGSAMALLYAYGGFNISVTPSFSILNLAWMEQGGVYASANLRGGGEYGEDWHKAGMKQNKQNVFDDFIAAAEWLVANKYTTSSKLAIRGGSNGGLLVGAVLNQRPGLFGAAIPAVGVMDMLRFDRFTIGYAWTSEYGSPKDAEDFRTLLQYSPLHNIRPGALYPPTMVMTADHDDRVVPAHSFKYAAALQKAQPAPGAPILIRIESAAGHGAGKPTSKIIDEAADVLAFLQSALQPPPR